MQSKLLIVTISLLIVSITSANSTDFSTELETKNEVFVFPTSSGDEPEESVFPATEDRILGAAEEVGTFFGRNSIFAGMLLGFLSGIITASFVILLKSWCSKRRFRVKMQMKDDLYNTTICSQNFGGKTILQEVTLISPENSMV
ncbi:unnamed protein product [Caenorhabditis angaria]|uniref:Uncharacterized protein n=1 Tax=Caenorhabditis angaria TaxID=860376 RepID=A0A9P1N3S4_9PELO|nr:unnamed protein product [Caenorhabditis angaria]